MFTYPQSLLSDGEQIQFQLRPHFRALFVPILVLVLVLVIGSWLFMMVDISWLRWAIVAIEAILIIPFSLVKFVRWITTQFVFTNRRIITRQGLISQSGRDMPLAKINNVSFGVPIMGRILNYGTLKVDSANTEGDLLIDDVPNVQNVAAKIYDLMEADDTRRRGNGPHPSTDGT